MLAIAGVYNIISDIIGEDCDPPVDDSQFCVRNYVAIMHIANKRDHSVLLRVQLILHLITTVAVMLFFHFIRYRVRKVSIDADDRTVTPSDFTLKIDGIPPGVTDEELLKWIKSFEVEGKPDKVFEVQKITRAYKILHYLHLFGQKNHVKNSIEKEKDAQKKEELITKLKDINEKLKEEKKSIQPTHVAFVAYKKAQRNKEIHVFNTHRGYIFR